MYNTSDSRGLRTAAGYIDRFQIIKKQEPDMTDSQVNNGVNVEHLLGARDALESQPEAAQFKWRTSCEWVNGTHSRSSITSFYGLGEEQDRGKSFAIEADHPEAFAAEDNAPTPAEIALTGLASCLMGGVAAVAQHRGIQLNSVKATVEGDMDTPMPAKTISRHLWPSPRNAQRFSIALPTRPTLT
jgi:organic hydroperoxide reductase OsmC/OhrA